MDISKKAGKAIANQVKRFRARFIQCGGTALGAVVTEEVLASAVVEENVRWRERRYGPLRTLELFIEQVLGTDHSCQEAVARGLSARVARGEAPCRLNTEPYCKARTRLSLSKVMALAYESIDEAAHVTRLETTGQITLDGSYSNSPANSVTQTEGKITIHRRYTVDRVMYTRIGIRSESSHEWANVHEFPERQVGSSITESTANYVPSDSQSIQWDTTAFVNGGIPLGLNPAPGSPAFLYFLTDFIETSGSES
jgi:hypothetical protein